MSGGSARPLKMARPPAFHAVRLSWGMGDGHVRSGRIQRDDRRSRTSTAVAVAVVLSVTVAVVALAADIVAAMVAVMVALTVTVAVALANAVRTA